MQDTKRDVGSIPGQRSPGVGNGNPFQYFCQDNLMDRGAWGCKVSDTTEHSALNILRCFKILGLRIRVKIQMNFHSFYNYVTIIFYKHLLNQPNFNSLEKNE